MPSNLYLMDGHAQFFRAYHAIRPGTMSSPVTKEPTNLTYGFVGMLLKLLREYRPDHMAVIIDVSGDRESFRSQLYPEYKANRESAPDDFHPQVERCLEILDGFGIPVRGMDGVEADDVIATVVRRFEREHEGLNIRILTRDKDLTQLIDDRVEVFDIHKDEPVTPESVFKTEGVRPGQVGDILALMGDSSDNIPGVPGIGPKTAAKLILDYGSIEGVYEHLDEIKGKRHENLEASREVVALSRKLVTLREDCEVELNLGATKFDPADIDLHRVQGLFRELGFGRHIDEVARLAGQGPDEPSVVSGGRPVAPQGFGDSLFELSDDPSAQSAVSGKYTAVTTDNALDTLVRTVREAGQLAIDVETDGLASVSANLCGLSVAVNEEEAFYVPTRSPSGEDHLDTKSVVEGLRSALEDAGIRKTGHNLKFDINVLRAHGVRLAGVDFDSMIASYVIDATRSSHSQDALALAFLKHTCIPISQLLGKGSRQRTFDQAPLDLATQYAAEDADIALRLRHALEPLLDEAGLRTLFDEVELPLVEVLAELEFNGIRVKPDELDRQRLILQKRIEQLRRKIIDSCPFSFNPDSPKQLAGVLFNRPDQEPPGLGLPVLKRGKTGPSTDVEVLERLAGDPEVMSEVPSLIVEYRQLTKLVNTYLVALKEAINPDTGRVHASFNQTVAATGRLSSSDPNLQNIPIRTEVGREIRRAFVAEDGHVLIAADYSQIELRLLAHLSGDEALIEAFHEGRDIHQAVAAEVFGVSPEEVTPEQRNSAKMVNFGIVYGITPFGLARRLGGEVSKEDAAGIINDYKARFARIEEFLQSCITQAQTQGYVETILGRRRAIPQIDSRNYQQRALGERMAINTAVQGSAADLIKVAMIDLYRHLPGTFPEARMLLQIHDELVFEHPMDEAEELCTTVVEHMEGAMELAVPLVVDASIATNWYEAK